MKFSVDQIQQIIQERIPRDLVVPEHTIDGHFYRHVPTNKTLASVTTKCGILENPHLKKWAANMAVQYIDKHLDELATLEGRTQVFKAAVFAHQQQFEEAGDIGTQGHGIIENYLNAWMASKQKPQDIKSFITGTDARLWAIARSAEMFCNDFNVIPVISEKFVCSLKYSFAGTLDSLMMVQKVIKESKASCKINEHEYWHTGSNMYRMECIKCQKKIELELTLVDWKTSNSIDKPDYAMQVSAYWQALYEMTGLRCRQILIVRLDKDRAKYEVRKVTNRSSAFKGFLSASKMYDWLNDGSEKLAPLVAKERILL